MTRQALFASLSTAILGIGFTALAFAGPAQGGATNPGRHETLMPSSSYTHRYPADTWVFGHLSQRPAPGYPCTWSGSRNLASGETAYRHGNYSDAITQWKAAASKDCAIAAYKLGMLYYRGQSRVAADRSLGTAWLKVAAESKSANSPYYQQVNLLAVRTLTDAQRARYAADYGRLQDSLGLPAKD